MVWMFLVPPRRAAAEIALSYNVDHSTIVGSRHGTLPRPESSGPRLCPASRCGIRHPAPAWLNSYSVTFHSYTEPHLCADNEMVRVILLAVLATMAKQEASGFRSV